MSSDDPGVAEPKCPVITVDGPNASGKGTVSQQLASRLQWHLLDSGALYRLVALSAMRRGLPLEDRKRMAELARALDVVFEPGEFGEPARVRFEGDDVTTEVRTEACGSAASVVATYPEVRAGLVARQRSFRAAPGLVADGRDMGTIVFRDAELKIFLTASPEVRARRRYKQLSGKGISVNLATLSAEIAERDRRDRERPIAPLVPAPDAIEIDTSVLSINTVVEKIWTMVERRGLG